MNRCSLLRRAWWALPILATWVRSTALNAGVVPTPTRGSVVTPGPNFTITGGIRPEEKGNLFHSFTSFSLAPGESATFTRVDGVTNVLARVTGSERSTIHGTISAPGANLFLINPNGVFFGPHAKLEVGGSFTATTADYVRLGRTGRFDARMPEKDVLTSTPVSAFGFDTPRPAAITLDRAQFGPLSTAGLHLVGGDIALEGATINLPTQVISLFSAQSQGEVAFDLSNPVAGYRAAAFGAYGMITLAKSPETGLPSTVDISGRGGGKVVIRGGTLAISGSEVAASTGNSDRRGGDVFIHAAKLSLSGSSIAVATTGDGRSGDLQIEAGSVALSAGAAIAVDSSGAGSAGKLTMNVAGPIRLSGGGTLASTISSSATSDGDAAVLALTAKSLSLTDGSIVETSKNGSSKSNGGDIHIAVNDLLSLEKGGRISADTFGAGPAGSVNVSAARLRIDGTASSGFTGIRSDVGPPNAFEESSSATGRGGQVNIRAGEIFVSAGGGISASTFANGDAGSLDLVASKSMTLSSGGIAVVGTQGRGAGGTMRVEAAHLLIDGRLSPGATPTGLIAQSTDRHSGPGGSIDVAASELTMLGGAVIEATTGGPAAAGSVRVAADRILLDGRDAPFVFAGPEKGLPLATAISARTVAGATGRGGDVSVTARDSITLLNRGEIEAATEGRGAGGNVTVRAGRLFAAGSSFGFPSGVIARGAAGSSGAAGSVEVLVTGGIHLADRAAIASNHLGLGAAGSVRVSAGGTVELTNGATVTAASRVSDAGTVSVTGAGKIVVKNGSDITASAGANGGNVFLQARDLLYLSDSRIVAEAGTVRSAAGRASRGGNIFIDPVFVILDHSTISANAALGHGGNILLQAGNFLSSATPITATGSTAGTVEIAAPELDLSAALAALASALVDASSRLQERCVMRLGVEASSFVAVGRGGVAEAPDAPQQEFATRVPQSGAGKIRPR